MLQIFVLAIAAGIYKESWLVFGGAFLGLLCFFMMPVLGKILALLIAGAWGFIGYMLGNEFFGQEAGYVIGGFFFIASFGVSLSGIEYGKDIAKE